MPNRHQGQQNRAEPTLNGKVAIPRLGPRDESDASALHDKSRVVSACNNCRKKKVKCNGERPGCKQCEDHGIPCIYTTCRKDRLKIATDHNAEMIELLKDLSLRASDDDKESIRKLLHTVASREDPPHTSIAQINAYGKRPRTGYDAIPSYEHANEKSSAADSDSSDVTPRDMQREDLLRSRESRATGYVGQNSDVQWLRSLRLHTTESPSEEAFDTYFIAAYQSDVPKTNQTSPWSQRLGDVNSFPVTDSSYYLDNERIDVDGAVNIYELPPADVAERLFECYMKTVHASFPVLPKSFEDQFRQCYIAFQQGQPFRIPNRWRTILNLVFAIGARYSHLINDEWQNDSLDHLTYVSRALRLLEGDTIATLVAPPDLLSIQATSLLSIYYLAVGHVSRAWITIGTAIRFALTVGLHLRNDDPRASPYKKESLVRVWWGLHSIESLLSAITGRPDVISDSNCTVPLPAMFPEEQAKAPTLGQDSDDAQSSESVASGSPSSSASVDSKTSVPGQQIPGSFLDARVRISRLTQKVLLTLYSPQAALAPSKRIRSLVENLMEELEEWASGAIPETVSDARTKTSESGQHRNQILLAFHYYSTKLLITRPCLRRNEHRQPGIASDLSETDQKIAQVCVQAAESMAMLLPDEAEPNYIYRNGPWWSIVHHIMQALAILLLEISYRSMHRQRNNDDLSKSVRKLILWLQSMRSNNPLANRAFNIVSDIIKEGDPGSFGDIAQLLPTNPTKLNIKSEKDDAPGSHFSHPYLQSSLDAPLVAAPQFQSTDWDRIEWMHLDSQLLDTQQPNPLATMSNQIQGDPLVENPTINPHFIPSIFQPPTTYVNNPFLEGLNPLVNPLGNPLAPSYRNTDDVPPSSFAGNSDPGTMMGNEPVLQDPSQQPSFV